MTGGISIRTQLSARAGVALQSAMELIRTGVKFTKPGFHPMTGFTPKPRELSPGEERLRDSSLRFLLRYFQAPSPLRVVERGAGRELASRLATASMWTQFCVAATQEYTEDSIGLEMGGQFGSDIPPRAETLVLSDLALEVQEAAMALLVSSYDIEVDERLLFCEADDGYDSEDDESYTPEGPRGN